MAREMAGEAVIAVETILTDGVEKAMAKFNRRNNDAEESSQ